MTSPVEADTDGLHRHAAQRRNESADFRRDKPPPAPDDPDDPTKAAVEDLHAAVHDTNQDADAQTNSMATRIDQGGQSYTTTDGQAAHDLGGVPVGGNLTKGVDAQGAGAMTNAIFSPIAAIAAGLGQSFGQMLSGTVQGGATELGQVSAGIANLGAGLGGNLVGAAAKNANVGGAAVVGLDGGSASRVGSGGEKKSKGSGSRTEEADSSSPPMGAVPDGLGGYVHSPLTHGDDIVEPASAHEAMPGVAGGMAGVAPVRPAQSKARLPKFTTEDPDGTDT
jgi:hypothetical protein